MDRTELIIALVTLVTSPLLLNLMSVRGLRKDLRRKLAVVHGGLADVSEQLQDHDHRLVRLEKRR